MPPRVHSLYGRTDEAAQELLDLVGTNVRSRILVNEWSAGDLSRVINDVRSRRADTVIRQYVDNISNSKNVPPPATKSNFPKWAHHLDLCDLPSWLIAKAADHPIIFLILAFSVLYYTTFFFIPYIIHSRRYIDDDTVSPPPIGGLQYKSASLNISISHSGTEYSGFIVIELQNTTDQIILYRATAVGQINGFTFNSEKIQFTGYAYPYEPSFLTSRILMRLPIVRKDESEPTFKGLYEYELHYRYVGGKSFQRKTARVVELKIFALSLDEPIGTEGERNITLSSYNQIDE